MNCSQCFDEEDEISSKFSQMWKKNLLVQPTKKQTLNQSVSRNSKNLSQKISLKKTQNLSQIKQKVSSQRNYTAAAVKKAVIKELPILQREAAKIKPIFQTSKTTISSSISPYASFTFSHKPSPIISPYQHLSRQNNIDLIINTKVQQRISDLKQKEFKWQPFLKKQPPETLQSNQSLNSNTEDYIPQIKINTCVPPIEEKLHTKEFSQEFIENQFQKDLQKAMEEGSQEFQEKKNEKQGDDLVVEWQKQYENLKEEQPGEDFLKPPSQNLMEVCSSRISQSLSGVRNIQDIMCTRTESIGDDSSSNSFSSVLMSTNNFKMQVTSFMALANERQNSQGAISEKRSTRRKMSYQKSLSIFFDL